MTLIYYKRENKTAKITINAMRAPRNHVQMTQLPGVLRNILGSVSFFIRDDLILIRGTCSAH